MKRTDHLLVAISSVLLIFFNTISLNSEFLILMAGVCLGSTLPDISGNIIKNYHRNPILLWLGYYNKIIIYPIMNFLFRTKKIYLRQTSNIFVIIIISIISSLFLYLTVRIFQINIEISQFAVGILIGGFFNILLHSSSKVGVRPLYPLIKIKIKGNISKDKTGNKRIKSLIITLLGLFILEFIFLDYLNIPRSVITKLNIIFISLIWIGFLFSANVFSLNSFTNKTFNSFTNKKNYQRPSYHNSIEKYNFEKINSERNKNGLNPLKFENKYSNLSYTHSSIMAKNGRIFHGNNVHKINAGYSGENVAMMPKGRVKGFHRPIKTNREIANAFHRTWMNSTGHRENILNSQFNYVGIGVYKKGNNYFATQLFSN